MRQQYGSHQGGALQMLHAKVRKIEEYSEAANRVAAPPRLNGYRCYNGCR